MRDRSGRLCLPLFFSPVRPAESAGLVTTAMHTDEYEIALSRELGVCEGYVKKYRKVLDGLEARHGMTTELFFEHSRNGRLTAAGELREWQQAFEAWQRWSEARDEYGRLLGAMRQSAP